MKTLIALTLLSLASPAFAQVKIVSEGTVDLRNITDGTYGPRIKPQAYGVPAWILHTYTMRTTISLQDGIRAKAERAQIGETEDCSSGGEGAPVFCSTIPPHVEVNLKFRSEDAKVTYELLDGETGQLVGMHQENLVIPLFNRLMPGDQEQLAGNFDMPLVEREKSDFAMNIDYKLAPKQFPKRMILSFDDLNGGDRERLEGAKIEVVRIDNDTYELKSIRLDQANVARTVYETLPMLDINYDRYHQFFAVHGADVGSTSYPKVLKSLSN